MKYTPEQLQDMAKTSLEAKAKGDPRYLQLIINLSLACGLTPMQCEARIMDLSKVQEAA